MTAAMCGETYTRPGVRITVRCTYLLGHASPTHSWRTLKLQDEEDAVSASAGQYDVQVAALLEAVACGDLDRYLEAILAGCHARKRARREVWTPPTGGRL